MTENKNTVEPLGEAKEILIKNGYTCVLYSDGKAYHSKLRGVKPLIEFLESGRSFAGFYAADKTVGVGAAHLYVLLGVKAVWANVMSRAALTVLKDNGIEAYCEKEVPFIINRAGTGVCPIESALGSVKSSSEALEVIFETLKKLEKA